MRVRRSLARAASQYAAAGVPVLPCHPLGKTPLITQWPTRATTDPGQIRRWWSQWPEANIGLVTGSPGYDVLDVDVRTGGDGFAALEELRGAGLLDAAVGSVVTPSGGEHYYFVGTEQRKSKLSGGYLDFQATGGYVIAPPSRLVLDGVLHHYRWVEEPGAGGCLDWNAVVRQLGRHPGRQQRRPARPPRHRSRPNRGRNAAALRRWVRFAPVGERNARLYNAANRYVEAGRDPWVLAGDARHAGLTKSEITATIRSAIATSTGERG